MRVEVVHVKDFGQTSKNLDNNGLYIYCGRPGKLGNPFEMDEESQRDLVIEQFVQQAFPHDEVNRLIDYCAQNSVKDLKLGCYCSPKPCHCDSIKAFIDKGITKTLKFKDFSFENSLQLTVRLAEGSDAFAKGDRIMLENTDGTRTESATIDEVIHIRFHQLRSSHNKYLAKQHNKNCRTYESLHQCMNTYYKKDVENEPILLITFKLDKHRGLFDE